MNGSQPQQKAKRVRGSVFLRDVLTAAGAAFVMLSQGSVLAALSCCLMRSKGNRFAFLGGARYLIERARPNRRCHISSHLRR